MAESYYGSGLSEDRVLPANKTLCEHRAHPLGVSVMASLQNSGQSVGDTTKQRGGTDNL